MFLSMEGKILELLGNLGIGGGPEILRKEEKRMGVLEASRQIAPPPPGI